MQAGGGTGFESYIWSFDHLDSTMADEYQAIIHGADQGIPGTAGSGEPRHRRQETLMS